MLCLYDSSQVISSCIVSVPCLIPGTCSPECFYYYQPVQQLPLLSVVQSYIDVWSYSHIACLFLSVPLNPDQPYESTKKSF